MSGRGWPLEAERAFWRGACAPSAGPDSLWWFVRIAWGTEWYFKRSGKTRWLVSRVHKPFLRWYATHVLAWLARRRKGIIGRTYILVLVFRNAGKTLLITRAANLWSHLEDRNLAAYIGSETHPKAKTFLESIKNVMEGKDENAWFSWLYGNFRDKTRSWNKEEVFTAYRTAMSVQEPTFGTYGLEMGITGMHPDAVTYDDPTSLETMTALTLQAARDSVDSTHPALRTDSLFTGVMTRYAGNDAAGHILAKFGVASWTGLACPEPGLAAKIGQGKVHVYFLQGRDVSKKTEAHPRGEPILPEVWDEDGMTEYEDTDPINYAAQIQNNPSLGEHMPLEYAQLDRMEISREDLEQIPIDFASVHLDTAFQDEARIAHGDFNVILGVLHDLRNNGRVYIERIIRNQKDRPETYIARLVGYLLSLQNRGYRVKVITDEAEAGGKRGTFKQLLQVSLAMAGFRVGPDTIVLYNRTNRKSTRLRKAAGYWVEGYVRFVKGMEHLDRLKYEAVNLDKGDHDDVIDPASDIWQPEVWKKPHKDEGVHDNMPLQPGDDVLRPGLISNLDRFARRAEYDPRYRGESDAYRDDPVG